MEGPQRLMDGTGTDLERALVQELRSYRGPRDMRAHTLATIGVTSATGIAAGGAVAWWSAKTWWSKLLLTVSLASLLGAAPVAYFTLRPKAAPAAPPALPAPAAKEPQLPLPTIAPAAQTTAVLPDGQPTPPPVAAPARASVRTGANLRAELSALDRVRSTVASGDFPGALALLEAYFRAFRNGRLQLEAQILRIDTLARCGQTDMARSYAKDFVRRHPKSIHAARLRSLVEP
jgi:hypothetical protein